jgi:hypothetical protein
MGMKSLGMSVALGVLLGGCGDHNDGTAKPTELSGILRAGEVGGVRYRTRTRTGLTDARGTFKYLRGETVTFSIGGIELGAVPGAAAITPFTLAGLTPPTTERTLRRELDKATRTTSNFVRALNIARLLLALDADGNPSNGIDARGRDSALATATLNIDQTVYEFAAQLERLGADFTRNIPYWRPVAELYRWVGVAVPAHAPVALDVEHVPFTGRLSTYMTYYPDGTLESESTETPVGSFGRYARRVTYDAMGREVFIRVENADMGGMPQATLQRYVSNERGKLTGAVREHDTLADGSIDSRSSTEILGDFFAGTQTEITRHDLNVDGVIDQIDTYEMTFDARANLLTARYRSDSGPDGIADSSSLATSSYDALGHLVSRLFEQDDLADGIVDARYRATFAYDASGRLSEETHEEDYDADGDLEYRTVSNLTYDAAGNRQSDSTAYTYNGSAAVTDLTLRTWTYDRDRHVISETHSDDWDADGVSVFVATNLRTYDDTGNLLRLVQEYRLDGNAPTSAYISTYAYGGDGELLSSRVEYGASAGQAPVVLNSTRVTNTLIADGVTMLAQRYLEFGGAVGAAGP